MTTILAAFPELAAMLAVFAALTVMWWCKERRRK